MTLPWVRHLWHEHQREKARAHLAALDAAALGSAAKYGGNSGRAYRRRVGELSRASEAGG